MSARHCNSAVREVTLAGWQDGERGFVPPLTELLVEDYLLGDALPDDLLQIACSSAGRTTWSP